MPKLSKSASKGEKQARVKEEMDKWKSGKLHSGSKKGPKVTSQKQAIAIALSESGQSKKEEEKVKKLLSTLALTLLMLPTVSLAASQGTITMFGNYIISGDFYVDSLLGHTGECLEVNDLAQIIATGSPCGGGGGVTSVTGSGNIASSGGSTPNITFTGTLPVGNGGTGSASLAANNVLLGNGTSALQVVAPGSSGNVLTSNGTTWASSTLPSAVSSVTSTTPLALTASPTVGAVSLAIPTNPIFGGVVTVGSLASPGGANIGTNLSLPYISSNQCLAIDGSQNVVGSGSPCGGGSGAPFVPAFATNGSSAPFNLNVTSTYLDNFHAQLRSIIPPGFSIGHLAVTCLSYNAADATAGNSDYTPLDSTGLGGGTIDLAVVNDTSSISAPSTVIGTVVIPSSPQGGPYVNAATVAVTPYVMGTNDSLVLDVSAIDASATNPLLICGMTVGP